jgi:hypothetical protein
VLLSHPAEHPAEHRAAEHRAAELRAAEPRPEPADPPPPRRPPLHRRAVAALSSQTALAVTVTVAVAGLALAFYVAVAQINLTNCLAAYNEAASRATAARADAAGQDRALDLRLRGVDTADRGLDRMDAAAFDTALAAIGTPRQLDAFAALRRQRQATAERRDDNDALRAELATQRAALEVRRRNNPLPAPPSQRCG